MPVSAATYERVALEDPEGKWELVCGHLRRKPLMTTEHAMIPRRLQYSLFEQLEKGTFIVDTNAARLRISTGSYYVPDLAVIPRAMVERLLARPGTFEVYDDPVPFVMEVWSPSTGDYDVAGKLPEYRLRGDAVIWFPHPYERTLRAWERQPDGGYRESTHRTGLMPIPSLPAVVIDLDALFG